VKNLNLKFWKKSKDISQETKATLEILIHEIQEIIKAKGRSASTFHLTLEIEMLLDTWIKANRLHPEKVQSYRFNATNAYPTTSTITLSYDNDNTTAHFYLNGDSS